MKTATYIHFSDLHIGSDNQHTRFSEFRNLIEKDLIKLKNEHELFFDFVIFTGDLTYSGTDSQFNILNEELKRLWGFLNDKIGCNPLLFSIPGNHDLERIAPKNPVFLTLIREYFNDSEIQDDFWKVDSEYQKLVFNSFREYLNWHKNKLDFIPNNYSITQGLMPGDFSSSLLVNDIKIGIIGLNSAFFQLSEGNFKNKLEISDKQLHAVCDGDVVNWCVNHDFSFLITHHGPDFLHNKARQEYYAHIYPPGRFFSHLFGHLHESFTLDQRICGSEALRLQQGRSLFGIKTFVEDGETITRLNHGYSVVRLQVDTSAKKSIAWPRASYERGAGYFAIDKDANFDLETNESFLLGEITIEDSDESISNSYKISNQNRIQERDSAYKRIINIRRKILTAYDFDRIHNIEQHVRSIWHKHTGPNWHNFHNHLHNLQVETAIYDIIPEEKRNRINEHDWFCLIASIWLHEVGMIIGILDNDKKKYKKNKEEFINNVRNSHQNRAISYIKKAKNVLKINNAEFDVIKIICQSHRINTNIDEIDRNIQNYHPKLLSAYLKVALLVHLDIDVNDTILFEMLHTPGISWETKFHWLKRKWINRIRIDHENLVIIVSVFEPVKDSTLVGFLPERIIDDFEENLKLISNVLIKGKISFFVDIEKHIAGKLSNIYTQDMELIRSNIDLYELSSASEAYETILDTLEKFTTSNYNPYALIRSYLKNINEVLGVRPCHALIRKLKDYCDKVVKLKNTTESEKVSTIYDFVKRQKEERIDVKKAIGENALTFLKANDSILLYGFSTMVINALSAMPEELRQETEIYIAECRGKTQYNSSNIVVYNDGINYMCHVNKLGFKKVYLIPDLSISNFMKRKKINLILFGANGIDKDTGGFGHTCGHLTIADVATVYKIPVLVIAETSKIGKVQWKEDFNRDIKWLPDYKEYLKIYTKGELKNPREDEVESDRITMIITEKGAKTPYQLKEL